MKMSYDFLIIKPKKRISSLNDVDSEDELSNIGNYMYVRKVFERIFPDIVWEELQSEFYRETSCGSVNLTRMRIEVYFENGDVVTQIHVCSSSRVDSSAEVIAVANELDASAIDMQTMKILC